MRDRLLASHLKDRLKRPFVDILFGARQTGKTTLLKKILQPEISYNLADPRERSRLLADPGIFIRECEALSRTGKMQQVFIDEVQSVPVLFDAVQMLYDQDKQRWKFVLCGSSARKLRSLGTNLLPGRSVLHRLFPLVLREHPSHDTLNAEEIIELPDVELTHSFPTDNMETRLAYGEFPGIVLLDDDQERALILQSYCEIHLQEEIRREALVRDWGHFVNFLKLAALESGKIINYAAISRDVGVSIPTVKSYYQLLEDMFMGFRVHGFSGSPRKNVLSTPRFLFIDVGIRHAAAGITPGYTAVAADPGRVFEQWIGAELYKRLAYMRKGSLSYFRTKSGAEVDYIVDIDGKLIPIEVKWTKKPSSIDARHLITFIQEQHRAKQGYIICRCKRPMQITENIRALPWFAF
jgi:uncharacterized protein